MTISGILAGSGSLAAPALRNAATTKPPAPRALARGSEAVTVHRDLLALAASGRVGGEIAGLVGGKKNAAAAVSLVQVADKAFADIAVKLERLKTLATDATDTDDPKSAVELAILNAEFARVRDEIAAIANNTEFNDTQLLQGGADPNVLTFSVKVADQGAGDTITISVQAATFSNLAPNLEIAQLAGADSSDAALVDVKAAIDKVSAARAELRGEGLRAAAAIELNDTQQMGAQATRNEQLARHISVDFALLVAEQTLDQRGIEPDLHDAETLRRIFAALDTKIETLSTVSSDKPATDSTPAPKAKSRPAAPKAPPPAKPAAPSKVYLTA